MGNIQLKRVTAPLQGEVYIPGDKSISHRAIMFASLAEGKTEITNFLDGEDCLHTIDIFKKFGVQIEQTGTNVIVQSKGVHNFEEPKVPLYFGNSGTTARLLLGLFSGIPYFTTMHGDQYLTVRPMDRVVNPLTKMGAKIEGRQNGKYLPIAVRGKQLQGMTYEAPVKSAQVKSAILLAGLFAQGNTTVIELAKTRDHTENMLRAFGANIKTEGLSVTIEPVDTLTPVNVTVPGDISSAAFLMVAGAIVPNSSITLKNVGLNETRTGIIDVMQKMNAKMTITNQREISGEWLGDITVSYSTLKSMTIDGSYMARLIDEIPIIALLATQAEGTTVIKDAEELRVKETDRIKAVVDVLSTLGANIEETEDGMIIHGKTALRGGNISSYYDHRIAMMGAIAALIANSEVWIDDTDSINISYPAFFEHLNLLCKQ
ncbi:MAG TPA: 3-phosphoshikimate 1-carboxyvinyltransferase [Candidatus Pseudogracilibacillus intestinigallinarum]|uniref:3-phosphoshikimate 1-carboxyvinyltransferase n=1 Tax=Candidatus Pseudogracilibacillus intestinigallinarum TaxID=2838742 RepID=A0A9D1PNC9_9BACI|nr:3-phosphoshikimate 1-carboxyvinyltransferase [Candidatus Pseudogracilibacillus intestinigallinarum]